MKHLTPYKLFEAWFDNIFTQGLSKEDDSRTDRQIAEVAKQEIEDVLLPLKDEGLPVGVVISMNYQAHIFIHVLDYQHKSMKWKDIKDDVERAVDVGKLLEFTPVRVWYKQVQKDGRIANRNRRETTDWDDFIKFNRDDQTLAFLSIQLNQVIKESYKKEMMNGALNKLFESDIQVLEPFDPEEVIEKNITEICYELTDFGKFQIDFAKNGHFPNTIYFYIRHTQSEDDDLEDAISFNYDEVKDVVIRIKDYLGDRFVNLNAFMPMPGGPKLEKDIDVNSEISGRMFNVSIEYNLNI